MGGLVAPSVTSTLSADEQLIEKQRAFDLLDALTRSGASPIRDASLHIILAATHHFDKTILDTVIQDSINPIEKVERSALIMATNIHGKPASELVESTHLERLCGT